MSLFLSGKQVMPLTAWRTDAIFVIVWAAGKSKAVGIVFKSIQRGQFNTAYSMIKQTRYISTHLKMEIPKVSNGKSFYLRVSWNRPYQLRSVGRERERETEEPKPNQERTQDTQTGAG